VSQADFNLSPPHASDATALENASLYTMGEYHDVWVWSDRWTASYIYAPVVSGATPADNVYFSEVVSSGDRGPSFYTVTPCRLLDTRNPDGPYGGPALPSGSTRTILAAGQCGIPSGAKALALNITAILPPADGWFTPFRSDTTLPAVPLLYYRGGKVRANHSIVPLSPAGQFNVYNFNGTGSTQFCVDVTGYFQ